MIIKLSKISDIRREYQDGKLHRCNLTENPMNLFSIWLNEAYSSSVSDPTAMCLATVDRTGQPFQRLVLLKYFINEQIIFFTNLKSRKSLHLIYNPKISVSFPWIFMDRQVNITGYVNRLPKKKVIKYFYTRPKKNQISAWVSRQSTIIPSRKILEDKFLQLQQYYLNKPVPFPNFWGGYVLKINSIEFWQGRKYRLHDRFLYLKKKGKWYVNRLSP